MNHPEGDRFSYDSFSSISAEIRLITSLNIDEDGCLELNLEHVKLKDAKYQALSYTWGAETPTHRILINGRQAFIRTNLYDFLIYHATSVEHHDVKTMSSPLWTDAICIDQNNDSEKSEQVALMSTIYSQAEKVTVWLGKESQSNVLADIYRVHRQTHEVSMSFDDWFDKVLTRQRGEFPKSQCEACKQLVKSKYNLSFSRLWKDAMDKIEQNDYWKRLWIVQELVLSGWSARLIVGGLELTLLGNFFTATGDVHSMRRYRNAEVYDLQKLLAMNTPRTPGGLPKRPPRFLLSSIVRTCSKQLCFDPRDKVFGLLGLTQRPENFAIDYAMTMQQLLHKALKLYAQEQMESDLALESESICGLFTALNLTCSQVHDYIANYRDHAEFSSLTRRYTWIPELQTASGEIYRMTFTARMSLVEQIHHQFVPCYTADFAVSSLESASTATHHMHSTDRGILVLAYHAYGNTSLNLRHVGSKLEYSTKEFKIDIGGLECILLLNTFPEPRRLKVLGCASSTTLDYETYPLKVYFVVKFPERLANLLESRIRESNEGKLSDVDDSDVACSLYEVAYFYECQGIFAQVEKHFMNCSLAGSGIKNRAVRLSKPKEAAYEERNQFVEVLEHLSCVAQAALPSYSEISSWRGEDPDSLDHNEMRRSYERLRSLPEVFDKIW